MRLIDAGALCEEFKERQRAALRWKEKAILDGDEERQIRADATLAFLSEVKLTIDNAPTVSPDMAQVLAYESGKSSGRPKGEWIGRLFGTALCRFSYFTCNNCGSSTAVNTNFCPNCGADMREGRKMTDAYIVMVAAFVFGWICRYLYEGAKK